MQSPALDEVFATLDQLQVSSNHTWTLIAAALVLIMQAGFLLIEAGMSRSKNSINVAQKNVIDFLVSVSAFYLLGFGLMFGTSWAGLIGTDTFAFDGVEDWQYTFFVFQAVFAGTVATIMSGSVAERMKFHAYWIAAVFIVLVVYPVSGHWAWGNLLNGDNPAYLADKGFIDFAGSTVVHSVGGWVALAAIIILGARIGKFSENGEVNQIQGHSYVLATAGAIALWVGWIGFNGGSTTASDPAIAHIIFNTLVAACFGGLGGLVLGIMIDGYKVAHRPINGSLGGLVAITAGCDAVGAHGALVIGLSAGVLVVLSERFIERVLKLDDVVGAVSVHGVCGAWGTVLLAFFALPDKLVAASAWEQALVQLEGVGITFVWAFGVSLVFFKLVDMTLGIRVTAEAEITGLNVTEHGASLGTGALQESLIEMTRGQVNLSRRFDETSGDEAAELATLFNPFIAQVHSMVLGIRDHAEQMQKSSAGLERLSSQFRREAQGTSTLSVEVKDHASAMGENARDNRETATEILKEVTLITDSADGMSGEVASVTEAISGLMLAIKEISQNTDSTSEVTQQANTLSNEAVATMGALSDASREIETVIELIQKITLQTNMLAINASIEAARAGESGKGFAIVAAQVRSLAIETGNAAEEIKNRIGRMRNQSDDASSIIGQITGLMTTIHGAVESITTAVNSQREVTDDISNRMERASKSASTVARSIQHVQGQAAVVLERTKENEAKLGESIEVALSLQNSAESSAEDAENLTKEAESVADLSNALSGSMQGFILDNEETQQDRDWQEQEQHSSNAENTEDSTDETSARKATGS
ncbi:ammonium transporter [Roseobacter sp. SK209-2-6]|uniref:ammonium transporter n=1 Tax=Roseobacter sp. SK209-2-6 TaxID=388739 RepID=UPI0000F3CE3F|nr:ammonium transporter [Roseobacter sp. SK209-2-6]EBA16017.1 ammonium transporter [Roseobacter sp. SK209-2-6]